MKKTLALALALVLCLGLCTPALATKDPVEGYVDPVEQYALDHPEEIAALDVDELLAQWGYEDVNMTAQELFLQMNGEDGETVEAAVQRHYIRARLDVETFCQLAELYRAEEPEQWAAFDADAYFEETFMGEYNWKDKAQFVSDESILTDEEFADYMFVHYMDFPRWDDNDLASDGEPALTLVVNGVASDVAIAANDWTTYADAAALRAILGETAVAPGYEGPVPIREAAENAGWDVVWYPGSWDYEADQVCLWNRDIMLREIEPRVAAYQQVVEAVEGLARRTLFSETPLRQTQTVTLTFKKFDTLDGDKTYTMKGRAEAVYQKGVADVTMTLDLSALVELLPADTVKYMALSMDLTADQLREELSAYKIELILDFNQGATAVRVPLLDRLNPGLGEWHSEYSDQLKLLATPSYAQRAYQSMVDLSERTGGTWARQFMEEPSAAEKLALEPDSIQKTGSTLTWTLKTDQFNAAFLALDEIGYPSLDGVDPFKKMDLTLRISGDESYDLSFAMRPNMDCPGIEDYGTLGAWFSGVSMVQDFDLSLTAHGDSRQATVSGKLHVKNFGVFDLASQSTTGSAGQGPRQIKDVERLWVEPAPDAVLTQAK